MSSDIEYPLNGYSKKETKRLLREMKDGIKLMEQCAYVELCADDTFAGSARAKPYQDAATLLQKKIRSLKNEK